MNWFRKHVKAGSRLALFALAIQFALSYGHFHAETAFATPAIQAGLAATLDTQQAQPEAAQPSDHDSDRQSTDCAICAVLSLANNFLSATPPMLALPQAFALVHPTIGAEFALLGSPHRAFQSRAPPVS